jgi:hypothetical protein
VRRKGVRVRMCVKEVSGGSEMKRMWGRKVVEAKHR